MSTTVDSRVVSMQFDNKQFEQNVAVSMSTLDKLKQKLNFSGAEKGLDNVSAAAKNVNMTGLANSVETVSAKFSALQVMGVTALANITNSAVNAGKRMVSALTIDPVKTGFNEYELKMNSVQTIMASTGESIETVNKYLEELNAYSDQTIYSFSDMTSNIGKFTNAGVKLEDAVAAIKGISNEAALAGANSNEASRAMYNFSQALSAGYVKLIDWKSIENANMATKGFKDELIKTAVEMKTVTEAGDGMYQTLEGTAFNATKNFNETLQDQWMTSEVLIETLKKYASTTTDIGIQASAAATEVKTFTQLWDTLKESAQSGWAKTWELLVGDLIEAKSLLTGISKVVGGFIDKMNDWRNNILEGALGSPFKGLKESLETILDPAKKVTESLEGTTEMLESIGQMAQRMMRGDFGNGMEERLAKFEEMGWGAENYYKVQNKVNELMGDSTRHAEDAADAQGEVTEATYDSVEALMELSDAQLKNLGLGPEQIKSLRSLAEYSEKTGISIKELSEDLSLLDGRNLLINSFKNIFGKTFGGAGKDVIDRETYESLEQAGIATKEWREQMIQAAIDGERLTKVEEGIYKIGETTYTTSQLFNEGLKENWLLANKTYSGLAGVLQIVKQAWQNIFPPKSVEERATSLYNIIAAFHKFTTNLKMDSKTVDNLRRTFEGLFALLDIILTLTSGPLKIAFTILTEILAMFDLNILDLTAGIGDAIVNFRDWIKENNFLTKALEKLKPFIVGFAQGIKDWFNGINFTRIFADIIAHVNAAKEAFVNWFKGLKDAENIPKYILDGIISLAKGAGGLLKGAFSALGEAIKDLLIQIPGVGKWLTSFAEGETIFTRFINKLKEVKDSIIKWFTNLPGIDKWLEAFSNIGEWFKGIKDAENIPKYIIQGLVNGLKSGARLVFDTISDIAKGIIDYICDILGIHSPSTVMIALGGFIIAGLALGLTSSLPGVWDTLKTGMAKLTDIVKGSDFVSAISSVGSSIWGVLSTIWSKVSDFIGNIDFGSLMIMGVIVGIVSAIITLANALNKLSKAVGGVGDMLEEFGDAAKMIGKGVKNYLNSKALLNFAYAVGILALSLVALSFINQKNLWSATGVIVVLAGVLSGLMFLSNKLSKSINKSSVKAMAQYAKMLLALSLSVIILAVAAKVFGSMNWEDLGKAGAALLAFCGLITGLLAATKLTKFGGKFDKTRNIILQASGAILVMAVAAKLISGMQWGDIGKAVVLITAFSGIIVGLMAATKLTKDGTQFDRTEIIITKAAGAILVMALAAKLIGTMEWGDIDKALFLITAFSGIIVGLMAATKLTKDPAMFDKTERLISKAASAILLMAIAAVLIGSMKWGNIGKAVVLITAFSGIIVGLMAATKLTKDPNQFDNTHKVISKAAGAILTMAIAAVLIGSMKWGDLGKAVVLITVFSGIIAALMIVINKFSKNDTVFNKMGTTVLAAAGAILIMGLAAKLIGTMEWGDIGKAVVCITIFGGIVAGLMAVTKYAGVADMMKTMIGISVVIGVLALTLAMLSWIKPEKLIVPLIAMTLVLGGLALVLSQLDKLGKSKKGKNAAKDAKGWIKGILVIVALAGAIALVAASIYLIKDVSGLGGRVAALVVMLTAIMGIVIVLKKMNLTDKTVIPLMKGVLALAGVAAVLIILAAALAMLKDVSGLGGRVASFVVLLAALTGVVFVLQRMKLTDKNTGPLIKGVLALAAVAGVLVILAAALSMINDVSGLGGRVAALVVMLAAMTGVIVILNKMGKTAVNALWGVLALTALMVPLLALVGILMLAQNVTVATGTLVALGLFMAGMVVIIRLLETTSGKVGKALLGVLALTILAASLCIVANAFAIMSGLENAGTNMLIMVGLLAAMTAVIWALTAMSSQIPKALLGVLGLVGIALALNMMVVAMQGMSGVSWGDIGKGLLILAGAFLILGVAAFVLSPVSGVLIILAAAIALIGLSMLLAGAGILQFAQGFAILAETISTNAAGIAAGISVLVAAMIALIPTIIQGVGQAIVEFCTMLVEAAPAVAEAVLAILTAIVDTIVGFIVVLIEGLSTVLSAVVEFLMTAIPQLVELVVMIVTSVLDAAIALLPKFAEYVTTLVATILDTAITLIPKFLEFVTTLVTAILDAVIALVPKVTETVTVIITAILDMVISLIPKFVETAVTVMTALLDAAITLIPKIIELGVTIITSLLEGIQQTAPILIETIVTIVSSILTGLGELIPQFIQLVTDVIMSMLEAVRVLVPEIINTGYSILLSFLTGIRDNIGEIITVAGEIIVNFLTGIGDTLPDIIDAAFKLIISFIDGLADAIDGNYEALYAAVEKLINAIIDAVIGFFDSIANIGKDLIGKFTGGMAEKDGEASGTMTTILENIKGAITGAWDSFTGAAKDLLDKFKSGMEAKKTELKNQMETLIENAKGAVSDKWESMKSAGKDMIEGFKEGVQAKAEEIKDAATNVIKGAVKGIKSFLGIESPSRLFMGFGRYVDEGFAIGVTKYAGEVDDSVLGMGKSAVNAMSTTLSGIADAINTDIDSQPTIRPVLDLTDVESKAGRIGGLLNGQSLAVSARAAGSISSMMNLRSQNGSNDDIVSALKDLRGDLANHGGDTYQINGVTYDDGSNIRAFAEAVIRQSRVGRRV